jgi:hypothetical protein
MPKKSEPMISDEKDLKFVLVTGNELTFKHFQPKSTNLIKVNIVEDEGVNGEVSGHAYPMRIRKPTIKMRQTVKCAV